MVRESKKQEIKEYNKAIIKTLNESDLDFSEMISVCSSSLMSIAMLGEMPIDAVKSLLDGLMKQYEKNFDDPQWGIGEHFKITSEKE